MRLSRWSFWLFGGFGHVLLDDFFPLDELVALGQEVVQLPHLLR